MKIIFRIFTVIITVLIIWVLIQNIDYRVSVEIFSHSYESARLPLIILFAMCIGFILGALVIAMVALQYKADMLKIKKKNQQLISELDSLRNLSIDEISLDDLNIDEINPVQIPLVEKSKSNRSEEEEG